MVIWLQSWMQKTPRKTLLCHIQQRSLHQNMLSDHTTLYQAALWCITQLDIGQDDTPTYCFFTNMRPRAPFTRVKFNSKLSSPFIWPSLLFKKHLTIFSSSKIFAVYDSSWTFWWRSRWEASRWNVWLGVRCAGVGYEVDVDEPSIVNHFLVVHVACNM